MKFSQEDISIKMSKYSYCNYRRRACISKYIKKCVTTVFCSKGGQFNFGWFNSSRSCGKKKSLKAKMRLMPALCNLWKKHLQFDRSVEPAYGESPDVNTNSLEKQVVMSKRIRNWKPRSAACSISIANKRRRNVTWRNK
jgi:hypothetical protein